MMTQDDAVKMSNEQAIQILKPLRDMMIDQNGCPISDAVFALDKAIEALSAQLKQHWIPCSERLPEQNQRVLTSICTHAKGNNVRSGVYYDKYFMNDNGDCWNNTDQEVLAWMPLPEPYQAERREE